MDHSSEKVRSRLEAVFGPLTDDEFECIRPSREDWTWVVQWKPRFARISLRTDTKTWEYNSNFRYYNDDVHIHSSVPLSPEQNARVKNVLCALDAQSRQSRVAEAFPNARELRGDEYFPQI
jgi:hypothetical protein